MSILQSIMIRSVALAQNLAQQASEGTMNSTITLARPSDGYFDEANRAYVPPNGDVYYTGCAGITPAEGGIVMDLGDEPTYHASITWSIPADSALPWVDDVLTIVANTDQDVEGRVFRVTSVKVGGRIVASTSGNATGIAPSRQWS